MQSNETHAALSRQPGLRSLWPVLAGVFIALTGLVFALYRDRQADRLAAEQHSTRAALQQMQQQVQSLSDKLGAWEAKERASAVGPGLIPPPSVPAPPPQPQSRPGAAPRPTGRAAAPARAGAESAESLRIKQLEIKFSEQDQKLASTQEQIQAARRDLEANLSTAKDELGGSIARTHAEVVALQKRGQRDYFEFQIVKSKQMTRVGPVSLALRKADTKRKRYDVEMLVDDNKLQKKNQNLLEPVYISITGRPQPLELVVNRIEKDKVEGYVSVPKFKLAELSAASPAAPRKTLSPD